MATTRAVCLREIQASLKYSVKQLVTDKIVGRGVSKYFDIRHDHIRTRGGGLIIFQGMKNHTADSIKSLEDFDVAWVEEAHKFSRRSFGLLRPTIRKNNSEIWASWNPDKPTDPVDEFFRKDPPDGALCVQMNYFDNPWFPQALREEMEFDRRRDPDRYKNVWLGGYDVKNRARVFSNWRIGLPPEFKPPRAPLYGGDFGFARDPSVLIEAEIIGNRLMVHAEAYKLGCEIDETPALYATIPRAKDWPITADSARPETISYLRRHGYPLIQPARKGPNSVVEGIKFLQGYDIIVHPDCRHTIDELTNYSYKVNPKTEEVSKELQDDHNHVIDSLRYAAESTRRSRGGLF